MKVEKWISYREAQGFKDSCGSMGGFFSEGMRWKDYIEEWKDEVRPYLEAIRKFVVENGLRLTGQQHQYSSYGVPLFEDGTIGAFSFRGWGDLMAAIWAEEEDQDYNYMHFYM